MKILFLVITLVFTSISFAGPGHGHSHGHHKKKAMVDHCKKNFSNEDVQKGSEKVGRCHIERLAKRKKKNGDAVLQGSWLKADFLCSKMIDFGGREQRRLVFQNKNVEKDNKLYIYLDKVGGYIAANFKTPKDKSLCGSE